MMLHKKQQGKALGFAASDKKIFSCFSLYKYAKYTSLERGNFWPQGHNVNKLGRGPLLDATYQISRLYALLFQTRRFFQCFSQYRVMLNM